MKKPFTDLPFLDGDKHCQSFTNKRTGQFLAAKTFRDWWIKCHEKCFKLR